MVAVGRLRRDQGLAVAIAAPSSGAAVLPSPEATAWPQSVIESVAALGAADAELWKAGADIARAADAKDVEAMWGAADGTVKLIEGLMPNIEALEGYPHTAELGAAYRASFPVMLEGATQIRDSITAGDSAGRRGRQQDARRGHRPLRQGPRRCSSRTSTTH